MDDSVARTVGSPSARRSLAVVSLDVGRVLADRDGVTFRALGTCMYPTVRPGDVLGIRSCSVADAAIGDIVVCRTAACLIGHRVVRKGRFGGRAYVVTNSDRSCRGADSPVFDDDLLGVVVSITRGGVSAPLTPTASSWPVRGYLSARLALVEATPRVRLRLGALAARAQDRQIFRRIVASWFLRERARVLFLVRVPLNTTLGEAALREFDPAEFDPEAAPNGRAMDRWTVTALVGDGRVPGGSVEVARDDRGEWRAEEPLVRQRYRGTGLDDMLLRQTREILERTGEPIEGVGA